MQCKGETKTGNRCKRQAGESGYCTSHAPVKNLMLKAHYADRCGFTPQYVNNLISDGVLPVEPCGKIDVDMADKILAERASRNPNINAKRKGSPDEDVPHGHDFVGDDGTNYNELYLRSRALKENELYQQARLKRMEEEKRLVDADLISMEWARMGVAIREKMLAIPSRLSGQVSGMSDPAQIKRLMLEEIRNALTELADDGDG